MAEGHSYPDPTSSLAATATPYFVASQEATLSPSARASRALSTPSWSSTPLPSTFRLPPGRRRDPLPRHPAQAAHRTALRFVNRRRRRMSTPYDGVVIDARRAPPPLPANPLQPGQAICSVCGKTYARYYTVYVMFAGCVRKHGNPMGVNWDDHPSCWKD
ncbi:hypothetical protein MMC06_002968 [Schaereria dolodes]|nr:hypothetical protein [Schaereria dolodes]